MAKMQVSSSLESIICFNLKYAIDFEKVINIVNKKKLGGFPGLLVRGLPGWLFGGPGLWRWAPKMALLGGPQKQQACSPNPVRCWSGSQGCRTSSLHVWLLCGGGSAGQVTGAWPLPSLASRLLLLLFMKTLPGPSRDYLLRTGVLPHHFKTLLDKAN